MPNYLRAYCQRADDGSVSDGPIRFVASTNRKARDGLVIDADAWDLTNYRKSPVVLWSHDYWGERPPIGRALKVWTDDGNLMADVEFDQADEFAAAIERKYRGGYLNAVSVGWDTLERDADRVTKADLLDISAVPIPGDPNALMERQVRGLHSVTDYLSTLIDEPDRPQGDDADAVWLGTALRMARLFRPTANEAFDAATYRRLCRSYERLGKTPPEQPDDLAALSVAEVRGLFLEGEAEIVPELFTEPVNANTLEAWWG